MAAHSRGGGEGRVQIGGVVAALKEEFPDISISKIRFLEDKGLVRPVRAESGYRYFGPDDIERVRFVLRAQRDRFWPLRVIAEALDAMDRGLAPDAAWDAHPQVPALPEDGDVPTPAELAPSPRGLRLTDEELVQATGLAPEHLAAMVRFGVLVRDADGYFGAGAVEAARAAANLADFGLEPRHLRPFRLAADREISLVEQASRTRPRGADRASAAEEILHECLALHIALVKDGLRRSLG